MSERQAPPEPQDDDQAVRLLLAAGGADRAIDHVFERYERRVLQLCCSLLGDRQLAEDAAQESFINIWRGLPRFDGRAALSTWIYAIVRNTCFSAARRPAHRNRHRNVAIDGLDDSALLAGEPAPSAVDERLVQQAVAALPERQRQVLQLYYWQDRSVDEVAAMLAMPSGTVKTLLHRGRQSLARALPDSIATSRSEPT
ncbi:MAG: RNA polymerase sigma factor [Steroidobacteraceae bacterium]